MIFIATYHDEPIGCGDSPLSVLMVNASLMILSEAYGCAIWKESRSDPGGAGVGTIPSIALVSPGASVSLVRPGSAQTSSGGGGTTTVRFTSLLELLVPTPFTAFTT